MTDLFFAFLALLVLTVALAALVIQSPARIAVKAGALVLAAGVLAAGYIAGTAILGRPKPARLEVLQRDTEEVSIVASMNVEGEAIHLWLLLPDETTPRAYTLPWSEQTAEALRKAQEEAEANGTRVRMRRPFRRSDDTSDQEFYAPPQPPMPEKS
ncbi:MAG: hypothetical protein D6754_11630 [Alphaproteobacteria bacterium]|nr:MAG: hypothetical protein D6754_11630 [Alphaproteobacteria bacterium]